MKFKYKLFIIYLLIIITLLIPITSFAENSNTNNVELNLYSKSCILIETSTNTIAYEKNSNEVLFPASTTKLLTAILVVEKCNLSDKITITNAMISNIPSGYTTAYLKAGDVLTIEQLLNVLLIPSANDAGYALAIHISGSIENFSILMNEKAKEIGCTNSNFTNPSGIHNNNHYSTAKDMSLIGLYSLKYPIITQICSKTTYTLQMSNGNSRNFETTNTLMKKDEKNYYENTTGLKTGFTQPAGSCIIATAKKDNMEFLLVTLGAPEPTLELNYRDIDCKTLFEYGFTNYESIIKLDKKIINYFNKFIISGEIINTIFKILFVTFLYFFVYTIITKNSKNRSKNSKKINKNNYSNTKNEIIELNELNELDELKFRCSFW